MGNKRLLVLTIALCTTLALGTDFRTIGKPGGGPKDHPAFGSAVIGAEGR